MRVDRGWHTHDTARVADRKFSDDEVARILARAAELQHDREAKTTGLDDIERAAAEAGIDPALVRAVASEMSSAAAPTRPGFFGPTGVSFEGVVDGVVRPEDYARLNDALQHALGAPVVGSHLGTSLQWSHTNAQNGRAVQASVSMRDGRITVRVSERLGATMGGIYGGVGGGAGIGAVIPGAAFGGFALLGPIGAVIGALVGTAASLFGTRALYLAVARNREAQLKRVFEALMEEARQTAHSAEQTDDGTTSLAAARARQGLADAPAPAEERLAVSAEVTAKR